MKPLVLTGYRVCLKVRAGCLVLFDQSTGEGQDWSPAEFPFDSVICEPSGGFVTFPALRWLAERGAMVSLLGFDGRPLFTGVPDNPINGLDRLIQYEAVGIQLSGQADGAPNAG